MVNMNKKQSLGEKLQQCVLRFQEKNKQTYKFIYPKCENSKVDKTEFNAFEAMLTQSIKDEDIVGCLNLFQKKMWGFLIAD